jgi:hypothetical protein
VCIAGAVLGELIAGAVWVNVVITLVIPRGRVGFIKVIDRLVDRVYTASGRFVRRWDRRDALLASQPVATLGLLLFIWLAGFLVGYGLLLWLPGGSFADALRRSWLIAVHPRVRREERHGAERRRLPGRCLGADHRRAADRLPAHSVRGLQPPGNGSYAARSPCREPGVGAGTAGQGTDGARRRAADGHLRRLGALVSRRGRVPFELPVAAALPVTRAAQLMGSVAAGGARRRRLHLAACPASTPFAARLCVQMGFTCLRKLTRTLRIPVEEDPRPDGPVQLGWEEFVQGWSVGFPVERTAEEAWPHFRGWRINYEAAAFKLASGLDAVPAR